MSGHLKGQRVAIIGGGIAGVTAATACAQRGARVTVHEKAPALTEVGAGLQVTPNGACVLRALGVDHAPGGIAAEAVVPTCALSGAALAQFDLGQRPYHFLHRADLLSALEAAAQSAGVALQLGARILDPSDLDADIILGADGLHSALRARLNGAERPFFTGQVAWRAILHRSHPPVARVWMAPGRHVVTYPLRGGRTNIVAVQERSDWAAEGWYHRDAPAHLRAAFADCAPDLRAVLAEVTETFLWGLFRHPIAPSWGTRHMALLGDAAHPTLPFLAQGANLALEDAWSVAAHFDALPRKQAVKAYQAARVPRVTRAIAAANANARNYHLSGAKRVVAHTGLRVLDRLAPRLMPSRLDWLYDYDVTEDAPTPPSKAR
ncbi:MAG: FAD-dependent oxidoreductase [Pseudomonadota bacterium]